MHSMAQGRRAPLNSIGYLLFPTRQPWSIIRHIHG